LRVYLARSTISGPAPCPDEGSFKEPVQTPVDETLARFIERLRERLIEDDGGWRLHALNFRSDDINGKADKAGRRAVSTFRYDAVPALELFNRASAFSEEPELERHPIVALAQTLSIRQIVDGQNRRDLCIYADESEAVHGFPASPLHASIRKSDPAIPKQNRTSMQILRSALADAFNQIVQLDRGLAT
jgi:hypothetical protein